MYISINWINDYVDLSGISPEELVKRFNLATAEIEGYEIKGEKIQIFNFGDMYRDFTYIDDIVKGVIAVMGKTPDENEDGVKYKVYNIGNNQPESLKVFVETLEECLLNEGIINKPAEKEYLPMQPGDVYQTFADVDELVKDFNFKPSTSLKDGLSRYAKWYKEFYRF